MTRYLKQRVFSWRDRFTIRDENGADCYTAEGEFFSLGKKLHVYDTAGREVIFIQQKLLSWTPRYFVFVDGVPVAEIVKELTFFAPRYRIDGLNWRIEGDFFAHEYQILQGGIPVASIHKEWFTWGDSYAISIQNPLDELPAIAVVLAIDAAMADANVSASASANV